LKKIFIGLILMATIFVAIVVPVGAANNQLPSIQKLYGAPTFVLNLIGKKDSWSGGGTYSGDRHTMFVPQSTAGYPMPGTYPPGGNGITIWMTQGADWMVVDGNALDGSGAFQLGPGKYAVFLVALGKPGNGGNVKGWIYNATDNTYLFCIGDVTFQGHSKTPKWENVTTLFWVSPSEDIYGLVSTDTWVFDYLALLEAAKTGGDYLYLWVLDNWNNKLIQVRFYKIG